MGLTAKQIAGIAQVGTYRDSGARGLYLQVAPGTGRKGGVIKSWIYRFVSPITGKSRWMGLGPLDVITLSKARDLARAAREARVLGRDPIEERRKVLETRKLAAAKSFTFGKCATD